MNILFVNYYDFRSQSGMHIFHLANSLARENVGSAVYSIGEAQTVHRYGTPKFRSFDHRTSPRHLLAECDFKQGETVIHCWTPRECARVLTESVLAQFDAPVVVHMEDNEEAITKANLENMLPEERESEARWLRNGSFFGLSHPQRYRDFLARSAGYTCIIEELLDFKPDPVPGHVFWPACEDVVFDIPQESSDAEKQRWGILPEEKVVFYPGNVHVSNAEEVLHLHLAIAFLRKNGIPVRIVTFGNYPLDLQQTVYEPFGVRDVVVDLKDRIIPSEIPEVMRAADLLVQPGDDNAFNRYRFPCKLPLFLASARPVVLPQTNLGKHLTNGENCLLLQSPTSSAEEIANYLLYLINHPEIAAAIGVKGRAFAREHFSWSTAARGLKRFYESVLAQHAKPGS